MHFYLSGPTEDSISEIRDVSSTPLYDYWPLRTRSRILNSIIPVSSDYISENSSTSGLDYSSRPYYTANWNYGSTTDYANRFDFRSVPYYTSRPYYLSTADYPFYRTSRRHVFLTANTATGMTAGTSTMSDIPPSEVTGLTAFSSTISPQPETTSEIPPTKSEYKGINNFFAQNIIFVGNNIFV